MSTLFLRTIEQVALFKFELAGQLSDGHWENSVPHDHWEQWCRCDVRVVPEGMQPGRNFWPKRDKYNLLNPDLLSVVGGRMIMQVRLVQGLGFEAAKKLECLLGCPDDFAVEPIEVPTHEGEFWNERRAMLKRYDLPMINRFLIEGTYDKRDLMKDLREIALAMKTYVDIKDLPKESEPVEPTRFYGHAGLARALAAATGLKVEVGKYDPPTERNAWYQLVTTTGMVICNVQMQPREDGTWVIVGSSLPWPDPEAWAAVQKLGL